MHTIHDSSCAVFSLPDSVIVRPVVGSLPISVSFSNQRFQADSVFCMSSDLLHFSVGVSNRFAVERDGNDDDEAIGVWQPMDFQCVELEVWSFD